MKLIVVLAFLSFASAHPVNVTHHHGHHHHFTEDEHVLFHLSKMVVNLNSSDIPQSITEMPIPHLSNCITNMQRKLIKKCAANATHGLVTPIKELDAKENSPDKSSEEHSELMHNLAHLAFPMTIGCIIETFIPMGMTEDVNLTPLKTGIINATSLSMLQKNSAETAFELCMSSNLTIIPYVHRKGRSVNMSSAEHLDAVNKKNFKEMKAMLCLSKAIILNGCPNVPRTAANLEISPDLLHSSEYSTETTPDKAEMLAHPQLSSETDDYDFLDLLAEIVMEIRFNDNPDKIKSLDLSKLLSCVPQEHREAIHDMCEEKISGEHHHMILADMMVAECVLVDVSKALNNVTGNLDVKVIQTEVIEKMNILSVDQKKTASASVESCIESNFTLPSPPHFDAAIAEGGMSNFAAKYGKRNNPMRALVCIVKALIENGCSSTKIEKRSIALTTPLRIDSSSGENSSGDVSDEPF